MQLRKWGKIRLVAAKSQMRCSRSPAATYRPCTAPLTPSSRQQQNSGTGIGVIVMGLRSTLVGCLEGLVRPLAQLRLALGGELRENALRELDDAALHHLVGVGALLVGLVCRDFLGSRLVHVGVVVAIEVDARALAPAVRGDGRHEPGMASVAVAVVVAALADVVGIDDSDAALLKLGSGTLCGYSCAGRLADRLTVTQWLFFEKTATTSSSVSTSSYSPMSATASKSRFTASVGTSFVLRT